MRVLIFIYWFFLLLLKLISRNNLCIWQGVGDVEQNIAHNVKDKKYDICNTYSKHALSHFPSLFLSLAHTHTLSLSLSLHLSLFIFLFLSLALTHTLSLSFLFLFLFLSVTKLNHFRRQDKVIGLTENLHRAIQQNNVEEKYKYSMMMLYTLDDN